MLAKQYKSGTDLQVCAISPDRVYVSPFRLDPKMTGWRAVLLSQTRSPRRAASSILPPSYAVHRARRDARRCVRCPTGKEQSALYPYKHMPQVIVVPFPPETPPARRSNNSRLIIYENFLKFPSINVFTPTLPSYILIYNDEQSRRAVHRSKVTVHHRPCSHRFQVPGANGGRSTVRHLIL
jgi:hypothetical protein